MEHGAQHVYELLDLQIAKCKLMTAGKVGMERPKGRLKLPLSMSILHVNIMRA